MLFNVIFLHSRLHVRRNRTRDQEETLTYLLGAPPREELSRMDILGIIGSLRRESTNTRLLHVAAQLMPDEVRFESFTALDTLPHFNPERAPEHSAATSRFISKED